MPKHIRDRVQVMLESKCLGGVRQRQHNHYLKGTVWCHRCKRRLIITRAQNRHGVEYFHYRCRGRQDQSCALPHLPVHQVEDAVLNHYGTLHITAPLRDLILTRMDEAHGQHQSQATEIREQLQFKIAKLDRQEDGYLDLVGDPDWPKEKISQRLRQVRNEREQLRKQLASAEDPKRESGREAIEILLDLLTEPRELYRLASNVRARSSTRPSSRRSTSTPTPTGQKSPTTRPPNRST